MIIIKEMLMWLEALYFQDIYRKDYANRANDYILTYIK